MCKVLQTQVLTTVVIIFSTRLPNCVSAAVYTDLKEVQFMQTLPAKHCTEIKKKKKTKT